MTGKHERRPGAGAPSNEHVPGDEWNGTSLPPTTDAPDVARCRCCQRPIVAPTSVRRLLGPVCAHRLAEALAGAAGGRFAVVLDVDHGAIVARLEPIGATS